MSDRVHPAQKQPAWNRRKATRGLALALALTLGACAALEEAFAPAEPPEPIGVPEPETPTVAEPALPRAPRPRPARVARLPQPSERAQPQAAAAPQPGEAEAPTPVAPPPDIKVVGLSREDATSLLGNPAEERDAAPAKIWRYAASECAVDLYFYLDVARNDFYALHYNVHDNNNGAVVGEAADRCLQRIYSEKHK